MFTLIQPDSRFRPRAIGAQKFKGEAGARAVRIPLTCPPLARRVIGGCERRGAAAPLQPLRVMRVGMSKEGHRNGRFEPVGATARTMRRGAMVEVLREGEEAGVELVVLVGLAESSCGDVGKAHAVRGPGLSGPVTQRSGAGRRCSYTSCRLELRPLRLLGSHLSGAAAPPR